MRPADRKFNTSETTVHSVFGESIYDVQKFHEVIGDHYTSWKTNWGMAVGDCSSLWYVPYHL